MIVVRQLRAFVYLASEYTSEERVRLQDGVNAKCMPRNSKLLLVSLPAAPPSLTQYFFLVFNRVRGDLQRTNSITTSSEQYRPPNRAAAACRFFLRKQSGVGPANQAQCLPYMTRFDRYRARRILSRRYRNSNRPRLDDLARSIATRGSIDFPFQLSMIAISKYTST
jgi:hypothetical protein